MLKNYINGKWKDSYEKITIKANNPATQKVIAEIPFGEKNIKDVNEAVNCAYNAYLEWRDVPVMKRVQVLYRLKSLMEKNLDVLAETITNECGKTKSESYGELQRAIENIEVACGTPMLIQGDFIEDIASGIDEMMIRQPLGVTACITPFNFPSMIVFWFLPYAIATGNAMVIKPSEKVPLTMIKIF